MAMWHLAPTDDPYHPFAVVDGKGSVAGCHTTRAAATIQMETLNVNGIEDVADAPASKVEATPAPVAAPTPKGPPPPIAFSTSPTVMW